MPLPSCGPFQGSNNLLSSLQVAYQLMSSALTVDLIMALFWFSTHTHTRARTHAHARTRTHARTRERERGGVAAFRYLIACPSWTYRPTYDRLPCMELFFEPSTFEGESITSHRGVAKHYLSRTLSHTRRPESSECRLFCIMGYQCS